MKTLRVLSIIFLFSFFLPMVTAGHATAAEVRSGLQPAKYSDVCMVQNRVGGMKMIPVEVEGKTYYGCCQGCVGKLKFDRRVRYTKDPVSGVEIDKAKAFIIAADDGTAFYFQSRETAEKFLALQKSH